MKFRHEIQLTSRQLSSAVVASLEEIDIGAFSGTVTYYFEVVGSIPSGSEVVTLFNSNNSIASQITVNTSSVARYRNVFQLTSPVTGLHVGSLTNIVLETVRVIVLQDTGTDALMATEEQFPLATFATGLFGSVVTPIPYVHYWLYESADWDPTPTFTCRIRWEQLNDKNSINFYLQEDDGSFGNWATLVTVVNAGTIEAPTTTTVSFTPTNNRNYRIAYSSDATKATYGGNIYTAHIIAKQVGSYIEKLADPSTLPESLSVAVAVSPNGVYSVVVAYPTVTSPNGAVAFKRTGDIMTKTSELTEASTYGTCTDWSSDGAWLMTAVSGSRKCAVYAVDGDVFTQITDYVGLPNSFIEGDMDDNGEWMVGGTVFAERAVVMQRIGTTLYKRYVNIGPTNVANCACISGDGVWSIFGISATEGMLIYKNIDGTVTYQGAVPSNTTSAIINCFASHDGLYWIGISIGFTKRFRIWRKDPSTGTFYVVTSPTAGLGTSATWVTFSADDKYLFICWSGSPHISLYEVDNVAHTFTLVGSFGPSTYGSITGLSIDADMTHIALTHSTTSPYASFYDFNLDGYGVNKFIESYMLVQDYEASTGLASRDQVIDADEWDSDGVEMFPEHSSSSSSSSTKLQSDPHGSPADISNSTITGANRIRGTTTLSITDDSIIDSYVVTV